MSKLPPFTRLPSAWIEQGGLKSFRWADGGSDNIAALLVLAVIGHHVDAETGTAWLTYEDLRDMASISRAKVSAALKILIARGIIEAGADGRGSYRLVNYDPAQGWAMFPSRGLYRHGVVDAFVEFRLRRRAELDAMKLYFLFVARRSRDTNMAKIGYEKIEEYSGVSRNNIRAALSVLTANGLIHIEHVASATSELGVASAYRLAHLESRRHMGTTGRGDDFGLDLQASDADAGTAASPRRRSLIKRPPSRSSAA